MSKEIDELTEITNKHCEKLIPRMVLTPHPVVQMMELQKKGYKVSFCGIPWPLIKKDDED